MSNWWDPEAHAQAEGVMVLETDQLPGRLQACVDHEKRIIWLAVGLDAGQRRSAVAYELGQLRQGPTPVDPFQARAHQQAAQEWAALMLIPSDMFVAAWEHCLSLGEMAYRCRVDVPTFRNRVRAASDDDQDAALAAIVQTRLSA